MRLHSGCEFLLHAYRPLRHRHALIVPR
jgi:hypothetical protein